MKKVVLYDVLAILLGIVMLALATTLMLKLQRQAHIIVINKELPHLYLPIDKRVNGQKIRTDQKVLLHIWSENCPVCMQEYEFIKRLPKEYNLPIISIHYNGLSKPTVLHQLEKSKGQHLSLSKENAIELGVASVPETWLVDSKNVIRYKVQGPLNRDVWINEVMPLWEKVT